MYIYHIYHYHPCDFIVVDHCPGIQAPRTIFFWGEGTEQWKVRQDVLWSG